MLINSLVVVRVAEDCDKGKDGEARSSKEGEESGEVDREDEAQVLCAAAQAQQEETGDSV